MKEEVKDLWVTALRSGKYKQGKGKLKNRDSFCCLGVLCDISGQGEWYKDEYEDDMYLDKIGNLPFEVQKWAGMNSRYGIFNSKNINSKNQLTNLNDFGHSFNQIADVIEENWEEL